VVAIDEEEVVAIGEEERWQEALKLEYDWHKHMTTLSAGIPIIIAALVTSELFPNRLSDLGWLTWSLILLGLSIFLSLASMVIAIRYLRRGPIELGSAQVPWFIAYRITTIAYSVVCFLGGISLFLVFVSKNF
jgi:hypothetical protein